MSGAGGRMGLWVLLGVALAYVASVMPSWSQVPVPQGRHLLPGLEWLQWGRAGEPGISVLRVDPREFRFQVMHFRSEGVSGPLTLEQWMSRTKALAVFNAGQYYPDFSYMGLLIGSGKRIHGGLHRLFQALFLAEPLEDGAPLARIMDLAEEPFDPGQPGYREVAQSFMLLDRHGVIRVRRTTNVAARTVVAEEAGGNLLVLVTQGPFTLWELAERLREGPFPIIQAMSMDGGDEAQLAVRTTSFRFPQDPQNGPELASVRRPLPTVIAIFPRHAGANTTPGN